MSELPSGWASAKLKDVVDLRTGPFGSSLHQSDYVDGGIPIVNPMHIANGHITPSRKHRVNESTADRLSEFRLQAGDIVLGRRGEMGRCAVVQVNQVGWLCGTGSLIVRPGQCIAPDFLQGVLSSDAAIKYLTAESVGSTMVNLNQRILLDLNLIVPPRAEQDRIVEKLEELLSDLDAGVAELKDAQRKLAQYRQSLLKAAVDGTLTADWRAAHGAPQEAGAELLQRILSERRAHWEQKQLAKFAEQGKTPPKGWRAKYPEPVAPDRTDLPSLPEGWVWASLDMLGEIASGVAKGTKRARDIPMREVPYLRVANVQRGYLDLTQIKTIEATESDIAELRLMPGDVLFNEGGDLDKLGRGWVWYGEVAECIHQNHVFRMRPTLSASPSEFISHHGNSFGKEWFKKAGKQTTNLASINMTMLRAFPVPVPPELESREIVARLELALSATVEQEKSVERGLVMAGAQRKNVLKAAFAGQLVPQDPNDEPASELLARIRTERASNYGDAPRRRKTA